MSRRNHVDKIAEQLIKTSEYNDKLKTLSSNASGLFSFLTGASEEESVLKELKFSIPKLKESLEDRLHFYNSKKEYNGNIPNLKKEIKKCDLILDSIASNDIEGLKNHIVWNNKIKDKYGF